jgi:hypothetical protein
MKIAIKIIIVIVILGLITAGSWWAYDTYRWNQIRASWEESSTHNTSNEIANSEEKSDTIPNEVDSKIEVQVDEESQEMIVINESLGISVPRPDNYIDSMGGYSGSTSGIRKNCSRGPSTDGKVSCTFTIKSLKGKQPLDVKLGSTYYIPEGEASISVGDGEARVFVKFGPGYTYSTATPGHDAVISGILDKHPRAAGDLGYYALWVEAIGKAKDVRVEFSPL